MKLGDMTIKQVVEMCHKHETCNNCPLHGQTDEYDCAALNHFWDMEINTDAEIPDKQVKGE